MLLIALMAALATQPQAEVPAFDRLKALEGTWRDDAADPSMTVTYAVIAGGSAVMETWRAPSGRQTMTVYAEDAGRVIATHYCAQGNQPTLELTAGAGSLEFALRSVTGLDAGEDHLSGLSLTPGDGMIVHRETYVGEAGSETTERSFVRVP